MKSDFLESQSCRVASAISRKSLFIFAASRRTPKSACVRRALAEAILQLAQAYCGGPVAEVLENSREDMENMIGKIGGAFRSMGMGVKKPDRALRLSELMSDSMHIHFLSKYAASKGQCDILIMWIEAGH
jgi:hypothetical protein